METILVEPFSDGWAVRTETVANEMVFLSGADAEDAARALAYRLAAAGEPVRLRLTLRGGTAAARFVCLPPIDGDGTPQLVRSVV